MRDSALGADVTPASERLGELDEYAELCRTRFAHAVPVTEPLVLISQIQRSGGSLLSQLFDGHAECHAHPYELEIGFPTAQRWPALDLSRPDTWFAVLYERQAVKHMRRGYSKPGLKTTDVEVFPFVFLPRLQKHLFDAALRSRAISTERDVLDAYFTSYFNAWLDNQNLYARPKAVVTGFVPWLIVKQASVAQFFRAYPDGTLISIIRDPRAWYASARRHRTRYADVEKAVRRWKTSTRAALDAQSLYGDRVVLLTYEQLVLEPEATMQRVAERIGIAMSEALLVPTFNSNPIRANSSELVDSHGILGLRADAYRESLDSETIGRIDGLVGELYERSREICAEARGLER